MPNSYSIFRTEPTDGPDRRLSPPADAVTESAGVDATPESPPVEAAFDPSAHTIDEVKAHLSENADQREAVLAAERGGKARTTLVDWLTATED